MNAAYKSLEAKLRIGELTLAQWVGLFVGAVTAFVWGFHLSPFGTSLTVFSACYIGGLPAAAIFFATLSELDIVVTLRAAVGWRRGPGRYVAGAGTTARGYVIEPDPLVLRRTEQHALAELDLANLWEA